MLRELKPNFYCKNNNLLGVSVKGPKQGCKQTRRLSIFDVSDCLQRILLLYRKNRKVNTLIFKLNFKVKISLLLYSIYINKD